jgi:cell wall-associated NlpC family hydrolase
MRRPRLLLVSLTIALSLAVALLRPLPGRAGEASPSGTTPAGTRLPSASKHRAARKKAKRRLAVAHRMEERMVFRRQLVRYARHLVGIPYRYGGTSPRSGFDCSGFVRYVYAHFGVSLPHSSFGDLLRGRRVARNHLMLGDLVFFDGAGHVGIYVGNGRFIHAPHTGTAVRISTMSDGWYGTRYVGARRVH